MTKKRMLPVDLKSVWHGVVVKVAGCHRYIHNHTYSCDWRYPAPNQQHMVIFPMDSIIEWVGFWEKITPFSHGQRMSLYIGHPKNSSHEIPPWNSSGPGILVPFSHLLSLFDDLHRGTGPIYLIWVLRVWSFHPKHEVRHGEAPPVMFVGL